MKGILTILAAFVFSVAFIWGSYAISKKLSYEWWYKSQVESTVMEVLEREGLVE